MVNIIANQSEEAINKAVIAATSHILLQGFHLPSMDTVHHNCPDWVRSHDCLMEAVYSRTEHFGAEVLGLLAASGSGPAYESLVEVGLSNLRSPGAVFDHREEDMTGLTALRRLATLAVLAGTYQSSRQLMESRESKAQ